MQIWDAILEFNPIYILELKAPDNKQAKAKSSLDIFTFWLSKVQVSPASYFLRQYTSEQISLSTLTME